MSAPESTGPARTAGAVDPGPPPPAAHEMFGERLDLAIHYVHLLAGPGVVRGLIGPREAPRLWARHLLNCAPVADLLPHGARVVDVGSGAGLPGLVLALRRPDLRVDLVESMRRRTEFLEEAVRELSLGDSVRVVRGRAEARDVRRTVGGSRWAVARAVAPLDRLFGWVAPLLVPGGQLLAMKGAGAADEVADFCRSSPTTPAAEVLELRGAQADEPVRVVRVTRNGIAREVDERG